MLHPKILEVIKRLVEKEIVVWTILTNGLADHELYRQACDMIETTWLVNINDPDTYTPEEWTLLNKNLELLMWNDEDKLIKEAGFDEKSLSLQLAINFYKPNQDYKYIIELAKKYNCPHIRYAPSHPSTNKTNLHLDLESLAEIKPTLLNFVKDCVHEGIKPVLECILPPCIFTTSEWRYLLLFSDGIKTICIPDIEIMPDLTVNCCVSLMEILPTYHVGEMPIPDMIQHFLSDMLKYKQHTLDHCKTCELSINGNCNGYCLRHKADHLKKGWLSLFT